MRLFRWTVAVAVLSWATCAGAAALASRNSTAKSSPPPQTTAPLLLAMCEDDGCSRWEFQNSKATGTFADGASASLTLVEFPAASAGKVTIHRVDTSGTANGINGTYIGTRTGSIVQGTFDWKWPGRPDGHSTWFAIVMTDSVHMAPVAAEKSSPVPATLNICEDGHGCNDWNFTGKTGTIPGAATLSVERFDDSLVAIRRNETSGALKGMEALYIGIRKGNEIRGVAAWKWSGQPPVGVVGWHTTLAGGSSVSSAATASASSPVSSTASSTTPTAKPPAVQGTVHSTFSGKIGMCEDSDGCSLWSFDQGRGQGRWKNGAEAQLVIEKLDASGLDIVRTDTSGIALGLIARYTGVRKGDWFEGDVTVDKSGHSSVATKFRGAIQSWSASPANSAAIQVPPHLLQCDDANLCSDWNLKGRTGRARGQIVGYNGALTVETFTDSSVVIRERAEGGPINGADIIYTGIRDGNKIRGVASWQWPGHGDNSTGATNFRAVIENIPVVTVSTANLNPPPYNLSGSWLVDDKKVEAVDYAPIGYEVRMRRLEDLFTYSWFVGTVVSTHRITGQRLVNGAWQPDEIEVLDPDHAKFKSGLTMERGSTPQPGDAPCDADNSAKVWAHFAGLRGGIAYQQQSFPLAFCWFNIAANQGEPQAEAALAVLLHNGVGTKQDFAKAFFWATESAKSGNRLAETALMQMYANGEGTPKDLGKAQAMKDRMAEQNVNAMFNELMHGNSQTAQLGRLAIDAVMTFEAHSHGPDCRYPDNYRASGCPGYRSPYAPH
jgi:Sel1 repeat